MSKKTETSPTTDSGLFVELEPPKGGLATLRGRLEQLEGRRVLARRLSVVAASVVPLVLLTLALWAPGFAPHVEPAALDVELTRMRLGLTAEIPDGVHLPSDQRSSSAVLHVSESPEVAVYYIATVQSR